VSSVPEIDLSELERVLAAGAVLVDVREDDEYADGHISGAHHVALSTVPERFSEIPASGPVYVICAVGGRSARATEFLRGQGIDAINVAGGTNGWIDSGRAVVLGDSPV
jgi:rhodanese-related sulfurtransferase